MKNRPAVPLIVKLPDQTAARAVVDDLARHIDLLPTILDVAGVPRPAVLPGRSLLEPPDEHAAEWAVSFLGLGHRRMDSLRLGDDKLIRYLAPSDIPRGFLTFDLAADPSERQDLTRTRGALRGYLNVQLERVIEGQSVALEAGVGELDPELEERLRTLGYIR